MRLVCPNCGAQYEVDASVIPASGRDVQCSACGHGWFVPSPDAVAASPAEADIIPGDDSSAKAEPWHEDEVETAGIEMDGSDETSAAPREPEQPAEQPVEVPAESPDEIPVDVPGESPAGEPEGIPDTVPDEMPDLTPDGIEDATPTEVVAETWRASAETAGGDDAADPDPSSPAPAELRRKTLDDAVMAILREEAEREAHARANEGSLAPTRHDLGLVAGAAGSAAAAGVVASEREASLRDTSEPADHDDPHAPHRRGVLPDIEEINSTLRATSERGDEAAARDAPETLRRKRSGFRLGFTLAFLIVLALLVVYVMAPTLSTWLPAMEPVLTAYVSTVDQLRSWLDSLLRSSTEAMRPAAPGN